MARDAVCTLHSGSISSGKRSASSDAPRSYLIRLTDIRDEIAGIRDLTEEADAEMFAASWVMTRAVEHALLIIAEASKHIPTELKQGHPEVPWQQIHGLGNMLRHEYRRIDPDVIWSVVTEHLEPLDKAVAAMIAAS